jgi:hypothetical protein
MKLRPANPGRKHGGGIVHGDRRLDIDLIALAAQLRPGVQQTWFDFQRMVRKSRGGTKAEAHHCALAGAFRGRNSPAAL